MEIDKFCDKNDVSNLFCKTKSHKNIVTWTQKQSTWNTYILFKILALELDWLIELNYNDNKIDFVQSIQKTKKHSYACCLFIS